MKRISFHRPQIRVAIAGVRTSFVAQAVFATLFAATLAGNWGGLCDLASDAARGAASWNGRNYRGNGDDTDAFREIVEMYLPQGESLIFRPQSPGGSLDPAERSIHLALSWARSPEPVGFGNSEVQGDASAIVASRFLKDDFPGFWLAGENGSAVLWRRGDAVSETCGVARRTLPGTWREMAGVIVVCVLLMLCVRMSLSGSWRLIYRPSFVPAVCAIAFFLVAAALTLPHTFVAPTGLGVYGGKAKLLYLSCGLPESFFVNPSFSSYQPAYPPGLSLVTLVAYIVAGGCGEWLTQLIPVFATALSLWLMMRWCNGSDLAALWIAVAFLGKQTLLMATFYYAEPFVALLSLLGWRRLRENERDLAGWTLIGASGLFKTEGLVLLLAVWTAFWLRAKANTKSNDSDNGSGTVLSWVKRLAIAACLPLSWHIGCHVAGATFYDYAPFWAMDPYRFCTAIAYLSKVAFLEPWRYGFAYPIAAVALASIVLRKFGFERIRFPVALSVSACAAFFSLAAFAVVYSTSRAADFNWHLWSSASRLLWVPSLFLLSECSVALLRTKSRESCSHVAGAEVVRTSRALAVPKWPLKTSIKYPLAI